MPTDKTPTIKWAIPDQLGIPVDPLLLRLDFHHESIEMTIFQGDQVLSKMVSAQDIASALCAEMSFSSGLLPENTLWWKAAHENVVYAIFEPARVRTLALQEDIKKPAKRFKIPLPPFIFLCIPCRPPWVYAVKKKPTKLTDKVYKAPLLNVFQTGATCPGSNKYPADATGIIESFFISFFSNAADRERRSRKFPTNLVKLWEFVEGLKEYPLDDLVEHGTVKDLLNMEMR